MVEKLVHFYQEPIRMMPKQLNAQRCPNNLAFKQFLYECKVMIHCDLLYSKVAMNIDFYTCTIISLTCRDHK